MESKHVCAQCDYPAANSTIFRGLESPFKETLECPNCGSLDIIPERRSVFDKAWKIICASDINKKIQEISGAYLQLSMIEDKQPKGNMRYEDLPEHVAQELARKSAEANKILSESGILGKLSELGVNVHCYVTASDFK